MLWCCITVHLYEEQLSTGVIAVAQSCCEPVLHSSTEQQGSCFALNSAAVHWSCITAHLYEEQISTGVSAVAQSCCEPVLQSSTEQQGSCSAMTSAAKLWCCIPAHLYEEQISIGVIAVAQAWFAVNRCCWQPGLHSRADECNLPKTLLQCSGVKSLHKGNLHCPMLLCKTGSQQAVCRCSYTYENVLLIQVCSHPSPMHCSKVQQSPLLTVALQDRLKNRQCVTALTPMEMCSSYRCAVTQPQCTAARFRAICSPHCSVLLCKTGSQQAVRHCIYTYGDVLFIQVCSVPAPMHCSKVQGQMQFPLFSAALQNRLTAGSVSLHLHLWRIALHTGVQ